MKLIEKLKNVFFEEVPEDEDEEELPQTFAKKIEVPKKVEQTDNFFDYYLPITVKIVDRYDEIENQNLSSAESKKFLTSTNKMVKEINKAYKKILDNLYKKDIVDMDAEMKVFNSLLKADG